MELIRPEEVSGKIISLISDAREYLIVVSPYNNFLDWKKMIIKFQEAQARAINISYYARKGEDHKGMNMIGVTPTLIENLHAKMYINEKYAILSSMNLVKASDDKSIDFAVKTETEKEHKEVLSYFHAHIEERNMIKPVVNPFANEIPFTEYFSTNEAYTIPTLRLSKKYYPGTTFIQELGFLNGNEKYGDWFYFSKNGLLEKAERFFGDRSCENINYTGKVSRYHLVFSIANVIGGLFNCSISDLYFKSSIKSYTKKESEILFQYFEKHLKIKNIDRDCRSVESLAHELHSILLKKRPQNII